MRAHFCCQRSTGAPVFGSHLTIVLMIVAVVAAAVTQTGGSSATSAPERTGELSSPSSSPRQPQVSPQQQPPAQHPPPQSQQRQPVQRQQPPRTTNRTNDNLQQQQLGGKCTQLGSCHLRGRRRDLDVGPDGHLRTCYCDQKCALYDDCCADAPAAAKPVERAQLGADGLRRHRQQWHCHRVSPIFGDIMLRATCSPGWLSSQHDQEAAKQVQRRCEYVKDRGKVHHNQQQQQADPIGMMMPITDLNTGITFANSFCLRCNNEQPINSTETISRKLVYWSPLVECTYNLDSDDRNSLWDLVSSRRGQVLRYSATRNKWLLTTAATSSEIGDGKTTERVCSITPTMPDSVEHMMRYCRAGTIDTCPPIKPGEPKVETAAQQEVHSQCLLGHQALVYSQTGTAVYRNLACARCNQEQQVFCEPRLRKNLITPYVNRVVMTQGNNSQRVVFAPPEDSQANGAATAGGGSEEEEGVGSRSGISGSFSVLMDLYGNSQEDEQVGAVHQCAAAPGQVYDPFFLTCRDVVCGLNHRFANGRCIEQLGGGFNGAATLAAPDRLGSSSESSSGPQAQHHRQQVAARLTESPDSLAVEQVVPHTNRSSAVHEASARLVGGGSNGPAQQQQQQQVAPSEQPQVVVHGIDGEEAMKNDPSLMAATQQAMSQWLSSNGQQMQPSSESRRAFAECGKILIQAEHYHLFSITTSAAVAASDNGSSTLTANLSGDTDNRLLQQQQQWHRERQVNKLWAYVAPYNLTLASSQFELIRSASSGVKPSTGSGSQQQQQQFNLLICSPFSSDLVAKFKPAMVYITSACLAISIASLALYLALYCLSMCDLRHLAVDMVTHNHQNHCVSQVVFDNKHRPSRASSETQSSLLSSATNRSPASQSLSSRGVACLASSLLAAYLLFIAGSQQRLQVAPLSCLLIALATYYCFLVAFNWMFLLAYDIWRTLRLATCQLRGPAQHAQSRRFLTYSLFALLSSALVVGLAIATDLTPLTCEQSPADSQQAQQQLNTAAGSGDCNQADALSQLVHTYRPKFGQQAGACWFANRRALALFFGLPVTLIMLVNLLFFLHSSFMVIRTSSRSSRHLQQQPSPSFKQRDARTRQWNQENPTKTEQVDAPSSINHLPLTYATSSSSSSGEDSPPPPQDGASTKGGGAKASARRTLETGLSSSSLTNQSVGAASIASSLATRYDAHLASLSSVMGSLVKDYRLYCRLSTIMGLTWLTGLMASVVDQSDVLWYLFVVLNTLQGLFIFIAFGCKRSKLANLNLLLNYLRYRWQQRNRKRSDSVGA